MTKPEPSTSPIKLAVLGAGRHSHTNHLPACAEFVRRYPGRAVLSAVCDLDLEKAEQAAHVFGFERAFGSLEELLSQGRPDGIVAVTPIERTAEVARLLMDAGTPACIEKPAGASLEEARALAQEAQGRGARLMVSVNRRFAPPVAEAAQWLKGRSPVYIYARMERNARRDHRFFFDTGIHAVDTVRHLAGEVAGFKAQKRLVAGNAWAWLDMTFANGATGRLDMLPTAGMTGETYTVFGPNWRIDCRIGTYRGPYLQCSENGRTVLERSFGTRVPSCVGGGAFGETLAFVDALESGGPFFPAPADVLPSMEICEALEQQEPVYA